MILSDNTIEDLLALGLVESPPVQPEQVQPASLDVRLGDTIVDVETGEEHDGETLILEPGVRYLGFTKEVLDLPDDLAAQLAGRSTIGRKGVIVHKTAGWIDPGFKGQITLELFNLGEYPVSLFDGERIAQLVFLQLDQPSSGYDGQYQGQKGPTRAGG